MVDIKSATAEIKRGIKKDRKKPHGKNIMSASGAHGGHNYSLKVSFTMSVEHKCIYHHQPPTTTNHHHHHQQQQQQ